jgi:intracellular sulfur oxidation DsrE/DsrF family protein
MIFLSAIVTTPDASTQNTNLPFMKIIHIYIIALLCTFAGNLRAQTAPLDAKKHKIVMQLSDGDSVAQSRVAMQIGNVKALWPNADIEIVCFGGGLDMLTSKDSKVAPAIAEWSTKGVTFAACNNSMRFRNIKKEELLSQIVVVPSAIVELAVKQEEGWSYFRAGK